VVVGGVLLAFVTVAVGGRLMFNRTASLASPSLSPSPITGVQSFEDLAADAAVVPYASLVADGSAYLDETVYFMGKVASVDATGGSDHYELGVDVTYQGGTWTDPVVVSYVGTPLVPGDVVEFVGVYIGLTPTEVGGSPSEVPEIDVSGPGSGLRIVA
jgi:hypothetical protein